MSHCWLEQGGATWKELEGNRSFRRVVGLEDNAGPHRDTTQLTLEFSQLTLRRECGRTMPTSDLQNHEMM